ncbi:MAG: Fe(3+) ABC transporter substrate-binding protein [Paracoccaceae bacterium]
MFRRFVITLPVLLALFATAPRAQEVNVYSYRQPDLVKPLFDAFSRATGIRVNVAFLNKGLIERLRAEGKRSPADVVLTVDIARLSALAEADVIQPVDSSVLRANIPANFRDSENRWFGLTSRARVVFASKERVEPGAITTYQDLADPRWRGRICVRAGTHAYNLALFAALIAHDGVQAAKDWLAALRANLARKPQGNDRGQIKAIWAGECDISLGNTYYMGAMLARPDQREWADAVTIVFARFEGGGTHVNLSGMAMTKAAPHPDNALKLMEFLSSPDAQAIYAAQNFEYPVNTQVPPGDAVAAWGTFTADDVPLDRLAALRATALRLVQEVHFDQ